MNNEKRKLICTFLEKYLLKKFPTLEIKKDKLFSCPFFEEHSDGDNSPTCKIYSSHGYKLKCMHPSHSEHDLGVQYKVRYFYTGYAKEVYCFEDELERIGE